MGKHTSHAISPNRAMDLQLTHTVKSNTTHMRDTPMPCSGAALSKVFETYAPTGALKPGAQGHFTEHLTWSFLQNDPNCQELSELRTIIATIFAYSQRNFLNPPSQLELAAGIRYFLPTGELAPEWIKFFDVAPGRYLGMAPMEVQNAYEREHDWSTTTMRQWVDAGVAARRLELAGSNHTASSVSWTQSRALERKRRHSEVSNQDEDVAEQQSPYFHANAKGDANFSSPVLPYSVHHEFGSDPLSLYEGEASRPVDMASFWQSHAVAQPCHGSMDTIFGNGGEHGADMPRILPNDTVASAGTAPAFTTVDQKRQRREGAQEGAVPSWSMPPPYHPSQYDLSPTRVDPASLQPVVDMNAVLLTGNPTQTVPSPAVLATPSIGDPALEKDLVDHSSAIHPQSSAPQQAHSGPHPAQHAAAIASGPQMSVNAPGSQTHRGKGFCQKGWSEDRVRAWTDIQGRPRGKLPKAALSPWGDEMSRGHTPKSVDPRHCPFETTMEENLTVSSLRYFTRISADPIPVPHHDDNYESTDVCSHHGELDCTRMRTLCCKSRILPE